MRFEVFTAVKIEVGFLDWFSGLKMEVVCSSDTSVSTYKSTRRYNTEQQHGHEGLHL
jgi:hypothetical protein